MAGCVLRGLTVALLALVGVAALPVTSGAATICVQLQAQACERSLPDVQSALNEALASPAADRVVIGPGRFEGPFHYGGGSNGGRIEIFGQGPSTVLTAPPEPTASTVLSVAGDTQGDGSLVSSLTVRIPDNGSTAGDTGISATDVTNARVSSDAGEAQEAQQFGVVLTEAGGYLRSSVVELVNGSPASIGVQTQGASATVPTTISDSRIVAPTGILASMQATTIVRERIVTSGFGVVACNAPATVEDTLIRISGAGIGLRAEGDERCGPAQGSLTARQDTVIGSGTASGATGAEASAGNSGQSPTLNVTLSVLRGVETAFKAAALVSGSSAAVSVGASDFEAARHAEVSTLGPASFSQPEPNLDADPLFSDELLGDFSLKPGSPAIDSTYSPPLAADESSTDLNGNPRVVDGNGDGIAARDMGAFETPATPRAPETAPPNTRILRRRAKSRLVAGPHGLLLRIRFTSTEPGSSFECRLDAGGFAPCTSPFVKRLAAGMHRFEVRAIDAAGHVDPTPAQESLRIARAPRRHHGRRHHHRPL